MNLPIYLIPIIMTGGLSGWAYGTMTFLAKNPAVYRASPSLFDASSIAFFVTFVLTGLLCYVQWIHSRRTSSL
jgi:hypothetical protein